MRNALNFGLRMQRISVHSMLMLCVAIPGVVASAAGAGDPHQIPTDIQQMRALPARDVNDHFNDVRHIDIPEPQGIPGLWTPSTPIQNPYSESKRVLGKILFWDEQLSSDNTVSCGSCHIPSSGGGDPRVAVNPGFDEMYGTADDIQGSVGVISMDEMDSYLRSELFGLEPQVTGRSAQSNMMGMFAGSLFWDGRASLNFVDPETGELMFQSGVAGLEIQATAPILNMVEMSHPGRTWDDVRDKLNAVRPLALADSVPADMKEAVLADPTYGRLFEQAFGDPEINAVRIAFALGTYQRTLVPDQTPWDLWNAGDESAMTQQQIDGFAAFNVSSCAFCHGAPTFSNFTLMVDGVRPPFEDPGRQGVTGLFADRGKFKTPSIRNVGLRNKLMHTGSFEDVDDIMDFYGHRNGRVPFQDNLHFLLQAPILFNPQDEIALKDFMVNGLTDPRVENETFPFDRPALQSELGSNPLLIGDGELGSGGFEPMMIAVMPPNLGNVDFKIGVDFGLGGAQAWVAVSSQAPVDGVVVADELLGPVALAGMGNGGGYGTMAYPISNNPALDGQRLYMQWIVTDPAGDDGFVRSPVAQVDIFCSESLPCTIACTADFNADGLSDFFDVSAFLMSFSNQGSAADLNGDGMFDFFDVSAFLTGFADGCP